MDDAKQPSPKIVGMRLCKTIVVMLLPLAFVESLVLLTGFRSEHGDGDARFVMWLLLFALMVVHFTLRSIGLKVPWVPSLVAASIWLAVFVLLTAHHLTHGSIGGAVWVSFLMAMCAFIISQVLRFFQNIDNPINPYLAFFILCGASFVVGLLLLVTALAFEF